MGKVNYICVYCDKYPTSTDPVYHFVEQLMNEMSKLGVQITVIAPQSLTKHYFRHTELHPEYREENVGGATIKIYQPAIITFGNHFIKLGEWIESRAIKRVLKKLDIKPDICYGHFWHCAYKLYPFAVENNIPLVVASGECSITLQLFHPVKTIMDFCNYVEKVICVSTKNKEESTCLGLTTVDKCVVIPNAVDSSTFKLLDKDNLRQKLGISSKDFVIAFCGAFDTRKGIDRVSKAIELIGDSRIKSIFIGGSHDGICIMPTCSGVIHTGKLPHNKLPEYLNSADLFVLPTLEEGCSNAIVEAMACGLPIVSSDKSFNYDILNETNSIMVDPMKVDEIANAIVTVLNNNDLRNQLRLGSINMAKQLTLKQRALKIKEELELVTANYKSSYNEVKRN